ncbi:hypothetical protein, partial [Mesorhizobium sp. M7A.F.Ca.ET.027.03.2.1]|uniref:hypothetical protein n=1 Tax=Mesorhizobium sp. M7A.F.Ca.ET.027.03.2.1 TaxID=2496656 RepID=UPI001AEC7576
MPVLQVPEPEPELQAPGLGPVLQVPEQVQVRLASSVPPVRARGPVCWPPAARLAPGAHHSFRK